MIQADHDVPNAAEISATDIGAAEAEYRRVASQGDAEQAVAALCELADLQFEQKSYVSCTESVAELVERFGDHPRAARARLSAAWAQVRLRDFDAALEEFAMAAGDKQLQIDARYGQAMVAAAQGNDAAVVELLGAQSVDALHPLAAPITYQRAEALHRMGDTAEALAGFQQLLDAPVTEPLRGRACVGELECLFALGRYDELQQRAGEFLDRVGQGSDGGRDANDATEEEEATVADVRRLLAAAYAECGESAAAADVLGDVVADTGPEFAKSDDVYRLALNRFRQGQYEEALQLLGESPGQHPLQRGDGPEAEGAVSQLRIAALAELKRFDEAIAIVEQTAASERATWDRAKLALLYAEVGRYADAAAYLADFEATPDAAHWHAVDVVAQRALGSGDERTASELFERMTASADHDVAAAGLLGGARCRWKQEDGEAALAALEQLAKHYPDYERAAEAALLRAGILAETRGPDPALVALQQLVTAHAGTPAAGRALLRLAQTYELAAQDDDAAATYSRLVNEYPEASGRDAAMLRAGVVLARLERADEADAMLSSLVEQYPDGASAASARLLLARAALDRQDYPRARELVGAVLAADVVADSTAEALYLKGLVAAAQGDWDDVDASMRRLLTEYSEHEHRLGAEYWVAEAAYRSDDLVRAETLLDELIRKTHGRRDRWVAMARLRRIQLAARRAQWDDVTERGNALLADFPEFPRRFEVDYLLGRAHVARADFDEARQAFGRVVASGDAAGSETAAMAQWMIGESYFHQHDYASARKEFRLVDERYADFPQWQAAALLEAGKCSSQLNEWEDAAQQFTELVRRYPGSLHSDEARQRLRLAEQKSPLRRQARR
ncbi:MAG: tetratricopeptide repeat protein [Pirellulales bacterium]